MDPLLLIFVCQPDHSCLLSRIFFPPILEPRDMDLLTWLLLLRWLSIYGDGHRLPFTAFAVVMVFVVM